jgi:hypothetical protein
MKIRCSAFGIGMAGAAVMSVVLALLRALDLTELNLEMMLGAMLTQDVSALTWLLGLAMHLVAGGVFALIYAVLFELQGKASAGRGVGIAAIHTLFSGLLMAGLAAIHPAVPEHPALPAPGFLAVGYGLLTAIGFVALHLLYGAIVGAAYRLRASSPAVPKAPRPTHSPEPHGRHATSHRGSY